MTPQGTLEPAQPQAPETPAACDTGQILRDSRGRSFRLVRCLGQGGFGAVHLAQMCTDSGMSRWVALKLLHPGLDPRRQALDRMRYEAAVLLQLDHPVIVAIHDLVEFEGRIGLVTEVIDGQDLADCMDDPIPLRALLDITSQLAAALAVAYQALRLVHRDIKPQNIRIGRHGSVKLLDFGIAHASAVVRHHQTRPDTLIGSLPYMAPERFVVGQLPEPASDVFALGCVLFEGLTGQRLLGELSLEKLAALAHRRDAFEAFLQVQLGTVPASTPGAVRALLQGMLSYEAKDRPSVALVAEQCEWLADGLGSQLGLRPWCRQRQWPTPVPLPETWFSPVERKSSSEVPPAKDAGLPSTSSTVGLPLVAAGAAVGSSALVLLTLGALGLIVGGFGLWMYMGL